MVSRPGVLQNSCNAGEFSPDVASQNGLKQYFSAMALMRNVEPVPQGGFRLSPRTTNDGWARDPLSDVFSVLAQSAGPVATAAVVFEWDLLGARPVAVVELAGLSGTSDQGWICLLEARSSPGGVWTPLTGLVALRTSAETRRVAFPPNAGFVADKVRLRFAVAPSAPVSLAIAQVRVMREVYGGSAPAAALAAVTNSLTEAYTLVFSDFHADAWIDNLFAGCVGSPFSGAELADVKFVNSRETLLAFHPAHPTQRFLRHSRGDDWSLDTWPWSNIPVADLGGSYVNTDEVWLVNILWSGGAVQGQGFRLSVDGVNSNQIVVATAAGAPDWTATAAAVKTALEDMAAVQTGISVSGAGGSGASGAAQLAITFSGAGNSGANFEIGGDFVTTSAASLRTVRQTRGKPGGEALMSNTAGWPTNGFFFQQRTLATGFPKAKDAFVASRPGEYFDLNIDIPAAQAAILAKIDAVSDEEIVWITQGRHLILLSNRAEYFITDRALTATQPVNAVRSSRTGSSRRVAPVSQENSILFVNPKETIVYAAAYSEIDQAYVPLPISLLASHLVSGARAAALEQAQTSTDADRYWLARDDGSLSCGVLIRNQDVVGFWRWQTDGLVRSVLVDGANRPRLLVERTVGYQQRLFLETLRSGLIFDAAKTQTFGSPQTSIGNLGDYEGAKVWALADGFVEGPFTVAGGTITLAYAASNVTVGRWTPPSAKPLPLVGDVAPRVVLDRPRRVFATALDLLDTTSVALSMNGGPARDVALAKSGDPTDAPTPPRTGSYVVSGGRGFTPGGNIEITQLRPGALHVRAFTRQARI